MGEIINGIPQPVNVGDKYVKATWFETVGSGTTSGTVTKPAGAGVDVSFVMDEWGSDTDALVSKMANGKPTFESPVDAGGNTITTTFNTSGEFSFSGTPVPAGDHAVIFIYKCYLRNFDADESLFESELLPGVADHAESHVDGTDDIQNATNAQKGLATAAQISAIEANTAKDTNVSTNLSEGTSTETTVDVNSSDGDNATLVSASTLRAGLLTKAKFDEIVANTAAKHTQGADTALGALGTKDTPVDADKVIQRDSADSDVVKTSTWTQIKAFLKTYFDTLYNLYTLENHASNHTDGTDDIQTVTNGQKGLMPSGVKDGYDDAVTKKHTQLCEAADFTKLDGIAAGANVIADANITDHCLARGDGGAKKIQASTVLVSDDGEMVNTGQPAYTGVLNIAQENVTGNGTLYTLTGDIWTQRYERGNNFSEGTFTAPVTASYVVSCAIRLGSVDAAHTEGYIQLVCSNDTVTYRFGPYKICQSDGALSMGACMSLDMDANDTFTIACKISNGTKVIDVTAGSWYSVAMIM